MSRHKTCYVCHIISWNLSHDMLYVKTIMASLIIILVFMAQLIGPANSHMFCNFSYVYMHIKAGGLQYYVHVVNY